MTKERQNEIIKEAWVRNLQAEKDIPESVGYTYSLWIQGLIKQAAGILSTSGQPQQTQQNTQAPAEQTQEPAEQTQEVANV